jgi:hypothetical protein
MAGIAQAAPFLVDRSASVEMPPTGSLQGESAPGTSEDRPAPVEMEDGLRFMAGEVDRAHLENVIA